MNVDGRETTASEPPDEVASEPGGTFARRTTVYRVGLAASTLTLAVAAGCVIACSTTSALVGLGLASLLLALTTAILLGRSLAAGRREPADAAVEDISTQQRRLLELDAELQQEVIAQASTIERTRGLERFLPPSTVRAMTGGERPPRQRAQLTVFRLALRGFAEKLEAAEPDDMAAMLNGYLSEMVQIAFSHGATVDKLVGDTVIGYFGAPESEGLERDSLRCGRLALELWHRAVSVCERWRGLLSQGPPVPTLLLTSGPATVGLFGSSNRLEYTAVGRPLDDAAGLIRSVAPGEVACTEETYRAIERELPGSFCSEVTLRGDRQVKLYRLAGPPESLSRRQVAIKVDRGAEMAQAMTPAAAAMTETQPSPRQTVAPAGELEIGVVLGDRYKVVRPLGEGGMGTIYLAHDVKLGSEVALKLLRQTGDDDPRRISRLHHEVKLARLVSHPNVARINDIAEAEGFDFISMEYIDGQTLDDRLGEDRLSVEAGLNVIRQLCAGLGAAHAAGIVHGDLKPANVMLEQGGRVVILDFGVARWTAATGPSTSDEALGTPRYMAPEQFQAADIDHRADIYALGVLAFEVFTGEAPFAGSSVVTLAYKHATQQPVHPQSINPELPPRLAAVILTCLAKAPRDRFESVSEIASCLAEFHAAEDGMVRRLVAPPSP